MVQLPLTGHWHRQKNISWIKKIRKQIAASEHPHKTEIIGLLIAILASYEEKPSKQPKLSEGQPQDEMQEEIPVVSKDKAINDLIKRVNELLEPKDEEPIPLSTTKPYTSTLYTFASWAYRDMLRDIQGASTSVFLTTYIFEPDHVGMQFADALIAKAREFGLPGSRRRIYVIIDFVGSTQHKGKYAEFSKMITKMREAGIVVHLFNNWKTTLFGRDDYWDVLTNIRHALFGRLHQKILLIDSQIAYTGGLNISTTHLNIRDTHIRLTGTCVPYIQRAFYNILEIAHRYEKYAIPFNKRKRAKKEEAFSIQLREFRDRNILPQRQGFEVLANRPDLSNTTIYEEYLALIQHARYSIIIMNAYFVPGWRFVDALIDARRRGVAVRIILSKKSNHAATSDQAAIPFLKKLVEEGVQVYAYSNSSVDFIHGKTMVVDEELVTIGSANLDYISLRNNYELNVFLRDSALAGQMIESHRKDMEFCEPYVLPRKVSPTARLMHRLLYVAHIGRDRKFD